MNLAQQAKMLANRVRKNFRKLRPAFERRNVGAFRVYDRDIPEIRAAIDWYEGHLVIAEYAREQTSGLPWLETMARAAAEALDVPPERVHLRKRRSGERYERLARKGERIEVREGDLRFLVNLDDYLDTGLFADHRETRARVRAEARGKTFLNLFAYTGSFTCAALKGGARAATSVDASQTYLDWARDNSQLNHLAPGELVCSEVDEFLQRAGARRWQLCVLDPPSFSDKGGKPFDVQRDHRALIEKTLAVLEPGGVLWFSTNHQRFAPQLEGLRFSEEDTVPKDYRNRGVHRAFRIIR
ncbi:MAG TPA: class I SAM-dependent methyltransferase [Myxococcales bacterium]|nr:class I SAM-dependent methyltransferase [Myxococcales bacterium]